MQQVPSETQVTRTVQQVQQATSKECIKAHIVLVQKSLPTKDRSLYHEYYSLPGQRTGIIGNIYSPGQRIGHIEYYSLPDQRTGITRNIYSPGQMIGHIEYYSLRGQRTGNTNIVTFTNNLGQRTRQQLPYNLENQSQEY